MATVAVRVDDNLKKEATELFNNLGVDMSTAVKMFLIKSVKTKSIPFSISLNEKQYDEEGVFITDERLAEATAFIREHAKKNAIHLDHNNPEHEAMLFDEEW